MVMNKKLIRNEKKLFPRVKYCFWDCYCDIICPADLPGRLAWQTCLADLPGRLAWQTCLADLPGRLAWQTGLADWPGRLAWQTGPADWPSRLARQTCPADLPGMSVLTYVRNLSHIWPAIQSPNMPQNMSQHLFPISRLLITIIIISIIQYF
jgi:hypothetical protein